MTLPFLYDAVSRSREFCRAAREAGIPPSELHLRRKAEYLNRIRTMTHGELRAEVLACLRAWRPPVTREQFWPQLRAALDELVAEGEVRTRTIYEVVG